MKPALTLLFALITCIAFAQQADNEIILGTKTIIHSKILDEEREIWVHVPRSGNDNIYTLTNYPVVYVLDGNRYFAAVTAIVQQLSRNSLCPEMIVVGILNTDRTRDLTPTKFTGTYNGIPAGSPTSGGADVFTSFIETELFPFIDSTYPTTRFRMLIGHSLGGLMVMNTFLNHGQMFNAYVSSDPSLWWDNQKLLHQTESLLSANNYEGKSLFLAIGNTMEAGMDTQQVRHDTSGATFHIRSILGLADILKSRENIRWSCKYYPDDDHGSVPLIGIYDAFRFFFSDYKFRGTDYNAGSIIAHYETVSRILGSKILPPENLVNSAGYSFMRKNMFDQAHELFSLNIQNYSGSMNVHDSMGEYYETIGDKAKAIEYYRKALTIREFPYTRNKLEKLEAEDY